MATFKKNFKVPLLRVGLTTIICLLVLLVKIEVSNSDDAGISWNADMILTEPIENCSIWQIEILTEYELSKDENVKARNAYILSKLWDKELLESKIKDFLVDKHYKLALLQTYGDYNVPNWQVQCQQTFPFPDNSVSFTPTLYKNGQVEWAPNKPQRAHAMSLNSSIIISQTGGKFENGDVIYYTIKIEEKKKEEIVWEKIITTNQLVLKELQNRHNVPVLNGSRGNTSQ